MDFITAIISLTLFALLFIKPRLGLYLTALSLPLIGIEVVLWDFRFPLADLVAAASAIAFLIRRFSSFLVRRPLAPLSWPLFLPFAVFLGAAALSSFFAPDFGKSFYYFLRWPFFLYFAYIFVPANLIDDARTLKRTISLVAASAFIVMLYGFLSLVGQDWQDSFFRVNAWKIAGVYPFGANHNLIAEFLNVGAFFALVVREFFHDRRWRRAGDIIFIFFALAIIMTFSRTGWITLAVQSFVYLVYRTIGQPQRRLAAVFYSLLGIAIISPLVWKMGILQEANESSTENRALLTEISWEAFKEKPVFGHGSGEFVNLVDQNIRFKAKYGAPLDSHGMIQKLAAENGALGLGAWLFLLLYLARLAFMTLRRYNKHLPWMLPFALAAAGGLFFQFFNTSYYKGKVWFPILLFVLAIKFSDELYKKRYDKDIIHLA